MMKLLLSTRVLFLLGLLSCIGAMAVALYFQWVVGLNPCPLCIFQRVAVISAGVLFLVATIHSPKKAGMVIYGVLLLIVLGLGLAIALRQVWLQHLPPDQVPACGPGLNYLLQILPVDKAIAFVLKGSGDCAKVDGRLLGLSMAGWSAVWFAGMLVFSIVITVKMWIKKFTK